MVPPVGATVATAVALPLPRPFPRPSPPEFGGEPSANASSGRAFVAPTPAMPAMPATPADDAVAAAIGRRSPALRRQKNSATSNRTPASTHRPPNMRIWPASLAPSQAARAAVAFERASVRSPFAKAARAATRSASGSVPIRPTALAASPFSVRAWLAAASTLSTSSSLLASKPATARPDVSNVACRVGGGEVCCLTAAAAI